MATAEVYTIDIDTEEIVDKFECDYNLAIGLYHGKRNTKGRYYIAKKGTKIPFPERKRKLKDIKPLGGLNQGDKREHFL